MGELDLIACLPWGLNGSNRSDRSDGSDIFLKSYRSDRSDSFFPVNPKYLFVISKHHTPLGNSQVSVHEHILQGLEYNFLVIMNAYLLL